MRRKRGEEESRECKKAKPKDKLGGGGGERRVSVSSFETCGEASSNVGIGIVCREARHHTHTHAGGSEKRRMNRRRLSR